MLSVQELRRMRRDALRAEQNAPPAVARDAAIERRLLDRILGEDLAIEGGVHHG